MNLSYSQICVLKAAIVGISALPTFGQGFKHSHDEVRSIQTGPQAYFENKVIDLGDVHQHERIAGRVFIENRGDEDLVIENLASTCGCTVLQLEESQRIVPPNEQQEITVFFSTDDRQGQQRKLVTVFTNDPEFPITELIVRSNVLASFQVLPAPFIPLVDVRPGDTLGSYSVFPTVEGSKLESLEIEVPGNILEYAMESIVNDDGVEGIGVTFSVAEAVELGAVDTELEFKGTVSGKSQSIRVGSKGSLVGPIEVRPTLIESTHRTSRGRIFAPVTLRPTAEKAFEVLSIDGGKYLDASQATGQKPGDIDITLKLNDSAPDGPLATTVHVRTDHPDMPIVEIPVFVDVLPRCRVQPQAAVFDAATMNQARRIRLQSDIVSKLEIRSASCDNPGFEVMVLEPSPDHPRVRFVELRWSGDKAPPENVTSVLKLETNVTGSENVVVPVEYRLKG